MYLLQLWILLKQPASPYEYLLVQNNRIGGQRKEGPWGSFMKALMLKGDKLLSCLLTMH